MVDLYVWNDAMPLQMAERLDAQRIGEIIAKLPDDDKVTALWKAARNRRHYLHRCYQWDVRKAAEIHWRITSARIIQRLSVMVKER